MDISSLIPGTTDLVRFFNPRFDRWSDHIRLDAEDGITIVPLTPIGEATARILGVLDGRVLSAPKINARISNSGALEGGFSKEEVQDLAIVLRSGPLPARLALVENPATKVPTGPKCTSILQVHFLVSSLC